MSTFDAQAFHSKCPELLIDLAAQSAAALQEVLGIDPDRAEQAGRVIADRMSANWAGQSIYFPKGLSYRLSLRDRKLFADFNGVNHNDLAKKYGVSIQWVYKIIKAVRTEEIASRQGDLSLEGE
jgi:Mor family transcriptional regulator